MEKIEAQITVKQVFKVAVRNLINTRKVFKVTVKSINKYPDISIIVATNERFGD